MIRRIFPKKIRYSQDHLNILGAWSTLSPVGFHAALRRKTFEYLVQIWNQRKIRILL